MHLIVLFALVDRWCCYRYICQPPRNTLTRGAHESYDSRTPAIKMMMVLSGFYQRSDNVRDQRLSVSSEARILQSFARYRNAFDNVAPCKTTIYNGFAEFKRGRVNFSDEFSDDRLSTAMNNKNNDAVLYKKWPSNLVWDIATGDETWIYYYDPKTKRQSTVWVYQDEPKGTKVGREQSASKRMVAPLFNKIGHVTAVSLENYHTTLPSKSLLTGFRNAENEYDLHRLVLRALFAGDPETKSGAAG
ncbi:hypothetical protein EVAR_66523_1 [Eumeta japonica]|uniref:Mariner Mos1 transposase n=1 Tax=Eumeta variegata TaxID=151549 RepID=A0A4C1ZAC9_EUMVA|nr:hypothetical protein EVAR_66523_1 [Eumeta japonica]